MVGQYKTQQPEKEVVKQLVDEGPFLQDVVPDKKTQHECEPTIHSKPLMPITEKCSAKPDFNERYELQIGVH
jgi:hypothetical protein